MQGVAVVGMGCVTPYGSGVAPMWQALLEGRSAIGEMDLFGLGGIACVRAGVIRDFTAPKSWTGGRAASFAVAACLEALRQAGIENSPEELSETALITASNFGDIDLGEAALIPPDHPEYQPEYAGDCTQRRPAAAVAAALRVGGPVIPLSLSCASGAAAVATAANLMCAGYFKRVVVVGYDAISRFSWSGLCSLRTMSKTAVRPFDVARDGTIFSEGAAALVLELRDTDTTPPLAWLRGWASGNNGHHITAPAVRGAGSRQVMAEALACAGVSPTAVEHVNMHGTGTKPNDSTESQALYDLLGERAATIPVTSVKGLVGHTLGAAGALELIVAVLSMREGIIPPTGNLATRDPECTLDVVTAPRKVALKCVLSNSAGFGGCNAAALVATEAPTTPPCSTTNERVLVYGSSAICALGADLAECGAALTEGEPALFDLSLLAMPGGKAVPLVGEAPEVDLSECGVAPKAYLDRASRYFLAACGQALAAANIPRERLEELQAGILCGTTWGCSGSAETFFADYMLKGPRLVKPFLFPHAYSNTAVSLVAMEWGLKGTHENVAAGATAAGLALAEAYGVLRAGRAALLLVGGVDVLSRTRLLAEDAAVGEGAALLLLARETALPDAQAFGEIMGCSVTAKIAAAAEGAIKEAHLIPEQICATYLNTAALSEAQETNLELPGALLTPDRLTGDVAGATSALHLSLGLQANHAAPFMVVTVEEGVAVAVVARAI